MRSDELMAPLPLGRRTPRPLASRPYEVIRDLALNMTMKEVAAKYGTNLNSVAQFKKVHAAEIEAARAQIEDALTVLPLVDKVKRVAEIQDMYFELRDELDARRGRTDRKFNLGDDKLSDLYGRALEMLKAIMVETGQMPARQTTQSNAQVTHVYVGIDMDAFKSGTSVVSSTTSAPEIIDMEEAG